MTLPASSRLLPVTETPRSAAEAIDATRHWLERAVIGLNLCPFAKLPHARGLIGYRVSTSTDVHALRDDLREALRDLVATDAQLCETSLLIHPWVLDDFLDYNDFLAVADALLEELELDGIIQIASFHPHYQFAGSAHDDMANCTNRSPWPMLHLLRETSVGRAVESAVDIDGISDRNIATLRRLGMDGWRQVIAGEADPDPAEASGSP